jgi:serine/threonine protein kinase
MIYVGYTIQVDKTNEVFKEAKNLQKLEHPNIIKLNTVFIIKKELFLMIEYFSGGDLNNYLKSIDFKLSGD